MPGQNYEDIFETPFGLMRIVSNEGAVMRIEMAESGAIPIRSHNLVAGEAVRQLIAYFKGDRMSFDFPIQVQGTPFQLEVWQAVCAIPYGETRTYKQVAAEAGHPKAIRAMGMANHNNPLMIVIPCHRVIGSDGRLTGYGGGLPMKAALLELESRHKL
mgnify:CR=1 FL=1